MNAEGAGGRGERGSVLVLVLLLLTLFVGLGFAFRQTMGLEGHSVAMYAQRQQALEAARAGSEVALSLLRSDEAAYDGLADPWAGSPLLRGDLGGGATYSALPEPELPDNGVVDLESRLSVMALPEPVLARLPGLSAAALSDLAAARKSAAVPTLRRFLDLTRLDAVAFERRSAQPPARVLTVLGESGALNANTASAFALGIVLDNEELGRALVVRRQGADGLDGTPDDRPWRSLEELRAEIGPAAEAAMLAVRSSLYSITATGEVRDGNFYARRRLRALVERSEGGVRVISFSEL